MPDDLAVALIAGLTERGLTIAAAESLTGGALTAELTRPAGASAAVLGGVVVYATELKHVLAGVDESLLREVGPVHPAVAEQLARGVRKALAVGGRAADIGISTTGVAGPDPQDGRSPGTVFIGIAWVDRIRVTELSLRGSRDSIRDEVVQIAIRELAAELDRTGV